MKELIMAYQGEMALKGLNRATFESALLKTMRRRLKPVGKFNVYKAQSTMYAEPLEDLDMEEAFSRISKIFGIATISRAAVCEKDFAQIAEIAKTYLSAELNAAKTFKVSARRADKTFAMDSMEIARELGGILLEAYPHLTVDVHHPDLNVTVEIRDFGAYVHGGKKQGAG
ncbi:MAG: THUMP domain-containing protein, partial [Ruthenibacterium sp.]